MAKKKNPSQKTLQAAYRLAEYEIEEVLGKGAFGVTYQAHDNQLNRKVAIKEFFPGRNAVRNEDGSVAAGDPRRADFYRWGLDRFLTEAQVLAQFKHANIVRVNRFFSLNNTGYMVMDYEEGCTLADILKADGPLINEAQVRELLDGILAGLEEVHAKKYLHRDIKPGNIYMRDRQQPVLIDFGAARLDIGIEGHEKKLIFTPNYSPPEQASRKGVEGPWSDFYSLGATFYRCMFGEPPGNSKLRWKALKAGDEDPCQSAVTRGEGQFSRTLLEMLDWMLRLDWRRRPRNVRQIVNFLTHQIGADEERQPGQSRKILLVGSSGADLQTALATMSRGAVLGGREDHSPLGLAINRFKEESWQLFRLPAQANLRCVWPALSNAASGVLLLVDDSARDSVEQMQQMIKALWATDTRVPLAIGVCNVTGPVERTLAKYWEPLRAPEQGFGIIPPLFTLDPANLEHLNVLQEGLYTVLNPTAAA